MTRKKGVQKLLVHGSPVMTRTGMTKLKIESTTPPSKTVHAVARTTVNLFDAFRAPAHSQEHLLLKKIGGILGIVPNIFGVLKTQY